MPKERGLVAAALDALLELAWPTRCVGCNLPGELLCERCRADLPWIAQRWACPMCGAPFGWLACTECGRTMEHELWQTRSIICALTFEGAAATIPPQFKDAHELRLAGVMAAAIAGALDESSSWPANDGRPRFSPKLMDAVCFVPATSQAYARRGFDHMELVCQRLSPIVGLPLADVLVREFARDQRTLARDEREANLAGTVRVIHDVTDMHLLVVDDVVTTGASMREAARALLGAGAASVTGCAFARVWRG